MRNRAWRRAQQARFHARALKRIIASSSETSLDWILRGRGGFAYECKNSVSETVLVQVRTKEEMLEYWRLRASREMNNGQSCNCTWCHGERRQGMGNSAKVLTISERSAIFQGTSDINISTEDYQPINHTWKRRKSNTVPR